MTTLRRRAPASVEAAVHPAGRRAAAALAILLVTTACPASAQSRGDTETVSHAFTFVSDHQEFAFDPNPEVGLPVRQTLELPLLCGPTSHPVACTFLLSGVGKSLTKTLIEDLFGVEIPGFALDVLDILDVNPLKIRLGAEANLGLYFEVSATTDGGVTIEYPLTMALEYPAPNTFACGERIEVGTSMALGRPSMVVHPPYHEIEFGAELDDLGFEAEFDFCTPKICVLPPFAPDRFCAKKAGKWCLSDEVAEPKIKIDPWDSPDFPPLVSVCGEAFEPGATHGDLVGCGAANAVFGFLGIALSIDESREGLVQFSNVVPKTPEIRGEFRRPLSPDLSLSVGPDHRTVSRTGLKQDTVDFFLDFVSLADYLVKATLPPGINLTRLTLGPLGSVDLGDITVNYIADHDMRFRFSAREFVDTLDFGGVELAMQVTTPGGAPVGAMINRSEASLEAGNHLRIDFPPERRKPLPVSPSFDMDGSLTTLTRQRYSVGSDFRLFEANLPELGLSGVLIEEQVAEVSLGTAETIEDHTHPSLRDLGGFGTVHRAPFALDPEDPVFDITQHGVRDVVNLGGGRRAVVYRVALRNGGDVRLLEVEADLDLAETFATARGFEAVCTHSAALVVNEFYDGAADVGLLAAGNEMAVEQASRVDALVEVQPAISPIGADGCFGPVEYRSAAHARGVSPIGTAVRNNFDHCTGEVTGDDLVATVDLGAAAIAELGDYAIYGFRGVALDRGFALSRGHVGSGRDLALRPRTAAAPLASTVIGDLHAAGDVHVSQSRVTFDYAQIGGRLRLEDPHSSFEATGAVSERSGCAAVFEPPALALAPVEGGPPVVLEDGEIRTLGPGHYSRIVLGAGSILTLTGGTFNVGLLRILGDGAAVLFDTSAGPVHLDLHDWLMRPVRGLAFMLAGEGLSTRDVTVRYAGRRGQILRDSLLQGTWIAPRAEIDFGQGSVLEGACYARRVAIGPGSRFSHHKFLEDLRIDASCRDAVRRP